MARLPDLPAGNRVTNGDRRKDIDCGAPVDCRLTDALPLETARYMLKGLYDPLLFGPSSVSRSRPRGFASFRGGDRLGARCWRPWGP
jgi:hypothetical protein